MSDPYRVEAVTVDLSIIALLDEIAAAVARRPALEDIVVTVTHGNTSMVVSREAQSPRVGCSISQNRQ